MSPPEPPSASGTGMPSRPRPAAWRSSASGKRPCASSSSATGADDALREVPAPCRGTGGARPRDRGPLSARYRPRTMSSVDDGSLARYADAIVRDGLLIGEGDVLAVHPEPIQRELADRAHRGRLPRRCALRRRARDRSRASRARARSRAPEDTLDWRPAWEDARMRELVREGAGIVWIAGSEDPQVLADVPPARAVRRVTDRAGPAALPPRRRARRRALRRRRVADPGLGRPGLPRARRARPRVDALGDDLLRFARLARRRPAGRLAPARGRGSPSAPRG